MDNDNGSKCLEVKIRGMRGGQQLGQMFEGQLSATPDRKGQSRICSRSPIRRKLARITRFKRRSHPLRPQREERHTVAVLGQPQDGMNELKVSVVINGKEHRALVDSGAPMNYITPQLVKKYRLQPTPTPHYDLLGVGGEVVHTVTQEIRELETTINGQVSRENFQVTPLASYPIILGRRWLMNENPVIDWTTGTIRPRQRIAYLTASNKELFSEFPDLLENKQMERLPEHKPWDHEIQLMDESNLKNGPIYRMTQEELKTVKNYIDKNLERGFI